MDNKAIKNQKAQGDVLLTPFDGQIPADAKPLPHTTLAYGEATGHHHTIRQIEGVTVFQAASNPNIAWVVAEVPFEVTHQEHGTVAMDPGTYQVDLQQQVDPLTGVSQRVLD